VIIKNNKVIGEERLMVDINQRIRDVAYLDNMLFVITDDGDIYKIGKK
jgi:glucose/arabinose dehydrogenase